MLDYSARADFSVESWAGFSYFDYALLGAMRGRSRDRRYATIGRGLNFVYAVAPPTLKPGQTLVVRAAGT